MISSCNRLPAQSFLRRAFGSLFETVVLVRLTEEVKSTALFLCPVSHSAQTIMYVKKNRDAKATLNGTVGFLMTTEWFRLLLVRYLTCHSKQFYGTEGLLQKVYASLKSLVMRNHIFHREDSLDIRGSLVEFLLRL